MRIALFGGTGFVGSYLVEELIGAGCQPVLLVRPGSEPKTPPGDACSIVAGDIANEGAIARALEGAEGAIYNIGILREVPRRGITFQALQLDGAKRVMDAAVAAGVKRFLLMSANGVRLDGTPYQRTKFLAEQHLAETAMDWTVFRPSVVFGDPRGRSEFASQLLHDIVESPMPAPLFYDGLLPHKAGAFQLSPVHAEDVARAFVAALQQADTIGRILPLGGPAALSWREIIATIAAAVGRGKVMLPTPAWAVATAATLLEHFPAFPITRDQIRMLMEGNVCSAEAFTTLGFTPRAFDSEALSYLNRPKQRD